MYSWDHKTLNSSTDPEYWDWTWADMGLYDDTANITAIKEATGEDKIFYIGYSQGTMQMHYGLAHLESEFHAQNLHKVVLDGGDGPFTSTPHHIQVGPSGICVSCSISS